MGYEGNWVPPCTICKESVNLEESKTDELGQAVHENCYVSRLVAKEPWRFKVGALPEQFHFLSL